MLALARESNKYLLFYCFTSLTKGPAMRLASDLGPSGSPELRGILVLAMTLSPESGNDVSYQVSNGLLVVNKFSFHEGLFWCSTAVHWCVYVPMCAWESLCVFVCEQVHVNVGTRGHLCCHPKKRHPPPLRWRVSFSWSPPIMLDWLANEPQGSSDLCLPGFD